MLSRIKPNHLALLTLIYLAALGAAVLPPPDTAPAWKVQLLSGAALPGADGQSWTIPVRGFVTSANRDVARRREAMEKLAADLSLSRAAASGKLFRERAELFLDPIVAGHQVSLKVGSRTVTAGVASSDGWFSADVPMNQGELAGATASGWVDYQAVASDPDELPVVGRVQLLGPSGVSVLCNVEEVLRQCQTRKVEQYLAGTFAEPYLPVEGMAEIFGQWAQAGAAFHYYSQSPWQLQPATEDFLTRARLPAGSLHMRTLSPEENIAALMVRGISDRKAEFVQLFKRMPDRQFVLVGHSAGKDPELFGELAREFPKQVLHIYIREVVPEEHTQWHRYTAAFSGLPSDLWTIFDRAQTLADLALPGAAAPAAKPSPEVIPDTAPEFVPDAAPQPSAQPKEPAGNDKADTKPEAPSDAAPPAPAPEAAKPAPATAPLAGHEILLWGTEAYWQRVDSYPIKPWDAVEIVVQSPDGSAAAGSHYLLVDGQYAFGYPEKSRLRDVPLSGWYVDAKSGKVTRRENLDGKRWLTQVEQVALWGRVARGPMPL